MADPVPAQRPAAATGRRAARVLQLLLPPLAVFVLVRLLLAVAAARSGSDPWTAAGWARWDSGLYLDIAENGYRLEPCPLEYGGPTAWCGNAGWFPAYPALVRLLSLLGLPLGAAAVTVSAAAAWGVLLLVWARFLHARMTVANLLLLVLVGVFPGAIYQHASFPISLFVLAVLLHLDLLRGRRLVLSGAAGAVAAASYPLGVLLPVTAALGALVLADGRGWARVRPAAVVGGLVSAGVLAVAVRLQLSVGRWDAYLLVQEKYGHGANDPLGTLGATLGPLRGAAGFTGDTATRWQTLLVAVLVLLVLAATALAVVRRAPGARADVPLALVVAAMWLMPLVIGTGVSLYRSEAALVPAVLLLRRLPRDVAAAAVVLAVPLAYVMAQLFFRNVLV